MQNSLQKTELFLVPFFYTNVGLVKSADNYSSSPLAATSMMLSRQQLALRRDRVGFVFQAPYRIPFLDVTDNVALLPMLAGQPNAKARKRASELLIALDVGHRAKAQTSQIYYAFPEWSWATSATGFFRRCCRSSNRSDVFRAPSIHFCKAGVIRFA